MRPLLLLLAAVLAFAASAQVYKWKDAEGRTHFGDRPPPDAKTEEVKIRTYEGTPQVRDWSQVIRGKGKASTPASAQGGVTMYSTAWCGVCKRARGYFATKGIAFTEVDVEKSDAGRRDFEALGGRGVPLILVGDKVMNGFSPEGFEQLRPARP